MPTVQRPSTAIRVAGLSFMLGAWFGVAIPVVLSHLARHGELPMTPWGFRALASPFEQLGPEGFGPNERGLNLESLHGLRCLRSPLLADSGLWKDLALKDSPAGTNRPRSRGS